MKKKLFHKIFSSIVISLTLNSGAYANSNADLAKAAQNPIANMASLPLQNNLNMKIGPNNQKQNILNVQPVIPFSLNDNWLIITRTIVPVMSQPSILTNNNSRVNGLGDSTVTAFFSPKDSGGITWGIGPVLLLPTATNDALGIREWGGGPSAVILTMPGNWVIGTLVSNVWSSTNATSQKVNLFTWQYFINYNMPNSWYLTSAPIINANWEASSSNQWTIPFGGGFGKIFKIGNQAINGQLSAYKNVTRPTLGASWQLRAQIQFLFPK